ncbi:MAG TPA: hypothetical protein VFW44_19015 [Bryobacteraceae bacterium]|nr:hypothetical protein [Bryobacteraceae bacterium]
MRHYRFWIVLLAPILAHAQWLTHPTPGIPRTPDGKPKLTAPPPRASNGKPDLSGLWITNPAPREVLERLIPGDTNGAGEEPPSQYFINILSDFTAENSPLTPAAAAEWERRIHDFSHESPLPHCLPTGLPMVEMAPAPYKIVQTPSMTVMLYERDTTFRQIYTDGRALPEDPDPSWLGYSIGKWEGDTFIVTSTGFNDRSWLDARGHTHSESLRLTERFHRTDFGHMDVALTVDDPKTYARPFTVTLKQRLVPDSDLLEAFCAENEKDLRHIPK